MKKFLLVMVLGLVGTVAMAAETSVQMEVEKISNRPSFVRLTPNFGYVSTTQEIQSAEFVAGGLTAGILVGLGREALTFETGAQAVYIDSTDGNFHVRTNALIFPLVGKYHFGGEQASAFYAKAGAILAGEIGYTAGVGKNFRITDKYSVQLDMSYSEVGELQNTNKYSDSLKYSQTAFTTGISIAL